jgi:hypothetical protein
MIMTINEYSSEIKKNWCWGMLPGDPKRVTSPQKLKWPIK